MSRTYEYAAKVLKDAGVIIAGDRKADYGDALGSFQAIAGFWTTYLEARGLLAGKALQPADVAMMMDLLKTSRFATGGYKEDTFVDKGGYSALGGALARIQQESNTRPVIYPDNDPLPED